MYLQDASISGILVLPELYERRDFLPAWTNQQNIEGFEMVVIYCHCVKLFTETLPNVLKQSPIRESAYLQSLFRERHVVFIDSQIPIHCHS